MRLAKATNPTLQRDTIESWLDVLVSMLNLPNPQRDQIRDELEDHLRSRVDDLLIMGKSEPDAIQTAIHELGETAELAKLISTASHTRTPFRRFAMNATFFVLAGSILTASVSMMMPTSTIPTHTIINSAEAIALATSMNPVTKATIDTRDATIADLFKSIADETDKPVIIHWERLYELGIDEQTTLDIDSDPISAALALTILQERHSRSAGDEISVLEEDDRIEIGTRSQFDRRTMEKRIYDISSFIATQSTSKGQGTNNQLNSGTVYISNNIVDIMQRHISPNHWSDRGGDLANASVLNSTLIITAPQRMHDEIGALLKELEDQHHAQQREAIKDSELAFERIRAEYEVAKRTYLTKANEVGKLEQRAGQFEQKVAFDSMSDEERTKARAELGNLSLMLQELQLELGEQERRYENLQSLLLNAEHDQLRAQLD